MFLQYFSLIMLNMCIMWSEGLQRDVSLQTLKVSDAPEDDSNISLCVFLCFCCSDFLGSAHRQTDDSAWKHTQTHLMSHTQTHCFLPGLNIHAWTEHTHTSFLFPTFLSHQRRLHWVAAASARFQRSVFMYCRAKRKTTIKPNRGVKSLFIFLIFYHLSGRLSCAISFLFDFFSGPVWLVCLEVSVSGLFLKTVWRPVMTWIMN